MRFAAHTGRRGRLGRSSAAVAAAIIPAVMAGAEHGGLDLLGEWRKVMTSLLSSVGGRAELPKQLLEPMQRQLELVQEVIERERALQRQVAGQLLAPADAVFDLLEQSGAMLRRQAEALESAGRALSETAVLMQSQAELFERTIGLLRQPTELAKAAVGLERAPRKRPPRRQKDR